MCLLLVMLGPQFVPIDFQVDEVVRALWNGCPLVQLYSVDSAEVVFSFGSCCIGVLVEHVGSGAHLEALRRRLHVPLVYIPRLRP